ncbi:MAG: hypothetical protein KDA33_14400 [Phycisphaerales bacterium]|nr:hypothetical protein [Phycisphaerales bacterium]
MTDARPIDRPERRMTWRDLLAVASVYLALALLIGPRTPYGKWNVSPRFETLGQNIALAETMAWREGHLSLDEDFYEDAEFNGKTYSVVGLAFTIMSVPITWIADHLGCATHFPRPIYFLLMTIPIPIVAYLSIRRFVSSPAWAALLSIGFVCGTPMGPEIGACYTGNIYDINHVIAVTGVFLIAADLLGARRIWPAAIGLILACWSRQMTCLYSAPLLLIAWRASSAHPSARPALSNPATTPRRYRTLAFAVLGIAIAGGIPLALNYLKFGNPLDTGYVHLYADRTDPIAERARSALFSVRYLWMHLRAMHFDFAPWDIRHGKLHIDIVNVIGGSLWLTTPLSVAIFLAVRRWWKNTNARILVLGTIPVIIGLHLYHTTGGPPGMYRYALDFLPIWWLAIAPATESSPQAKRVTIAAVAYSVLYYATLHW